MRNAINTHRRRERQSISARRTAAYERPLDDAVLPEQFFDARVKLAAVSPETALMYAVLEDAFLCFHRQFEADRARLQSAREAEDWFFNDDSCWLFSFRSICNALGLEPGYIRQKLKHWTPSRLNTEPANLRFSDHAAE